MKLLLKFDPHPRDALQRLALLVVALRRAQLPPAEPRGAQVLQQAELMMESAQFRCAAIRPDELKAAPDGQSEILSGSFLPQIVPALLAPLPFFAKFAHSIFPRYTLTASLR